ncbi:GreA/GreB family elongation factor [Variovorax terrae]|uniref:GreA/GreB family elongation factor n=1 Tax=Variovorax terrae TaxID=2923278 RepID=A0A9X2AN23_9BURK|nr:GreA/GreB family elongation factor [Variovorax terrae]MCJ0761947.1 GreA/GreB family elongation factor [Variovorax terrae]
MLSSVQEMRTLTELDHTRISKLLPREQAGSAIAAVLDAADLVPAREVPADVVTMYSQVLLADLATGTQRKITLCYPRDAEPATGFVSVLSPVGASLLGLPVGALAGWTTPDGQQASGRVLDILFQPEASGDYTL